MATEEDKGELVIVVASNHDLMVGRRSQGAGAEDWEEKRIKGLGRKENKGTRFVIGGFDNCTYIFLIF